PDPISFSKADLRRALVGIDDIPRSHGTDFADFVIDRDALPGSESVVSGAPECGEYLDDEFASTPVAEVSRAYADPVSGVTVLHTIAHHEPDGADDELEEIRYLLSECDRFRMVQAGSEVEVATDL